MLNVLAAIQALGLALELAAMVQAMIEKGTAEGRDLTADELAAIQAETDALYASVVGRLDAAAKEG